jgi:ComF family protein
MHDYLVKLKQSLENFLSPAYCSFCKILMEKRFPLCNSCFQKIQPVVPAVISLTSHKKMSVFAVGAYEEPLKSLIRAKQSRHDIAAHQLGILVVNSFTDHSIPIDYLMPIPLHWRRYAVRGYNQAELMALEVGRALRVPVVELLERKRYTAYQMTCAASERYANVAGAFSFAKNLKAESKKLYKNKHLVIVDDLMTTGATLEAAGRLLLQLQPASISVIVGARVIS